jgi:hypothetical protein
MLHKLNALLLLVPAIIQPITAHAQQSPPRQSARTVVILLSAESGLVDAAQVATKDIVDRVTSLRGAQVGMHFVEIRGCPKVPADTIQAVASELQTRRFVVVLDLNDVDPRLCAR